MKKTVDEKLNNIFDIVPTVVPNVQHEVVAERATNVVENATEVDDDYEYARKNLRTLIDNGKDVMENLTFLAKEGESPRAYEVIGQMIKTLADTNKDLLNLAKAKKEIQQNKNEEQQNPTHVTNALFVGTTDELQKLLKRQ
jgi:uncharacterized phage infection (PIP) family protein YhgE